MRSKYADPDKAKDNGRVHVAILYILSVLCYCYSFVCIITSAAFLRNQG